MMISVVCTEDFESSNCRPSYFSTKIRWSNFTSDEANEENPNRNESQQYRIEAMVFSLSLVFTRRLQYRWPTAPSRHRKKDIPLIFAIERRSGLTFHLVESEPSLGRIFESGRTSAHFELCSSNLRNKIWPQPTLETMYV